jgi:hypothetical protein
MNIQAEYNRLQLKRKKFRRASLSCGLAVALSVFWWGPLGQVIGIGAVYLWIILLISGFVFRSMAVSARDTAKVMEAQLASQGLTPNLSPINAVPIADQVQVEQQMPAAAPSAAPAQAKATKAPEANIESRLAKARRVNN